MAYIEGEYARAYSEKPDGLTCRPHVIAGHGTNDVGLLLLLAEIGRRVEVLRQGGRIQTAAVSSLEYGRTAQKIKHVG